MWWVGLGLASSLKDLKGNNHFTQKLAQIKISVKNAYSENVHRMIIASSALPSENS